MEPLYSIEFSMTYDIYMEYQYLCLSGKMKEERIGQVAFLMLLVSILGFVVFFMTKDITLLILSLAIFIFCVAYKPIIKALLKKAAKKAWDSNKTIQNQTYKYDFYDDRFECASESGMAKYEYAKLHKILEGDKMYSFMIANNQGMPVDKSKCSDSIIEFIDSLLEKYPNLEEGN